MFLVLRRESTSPRRAFQATLTLMRANRLVTSHGRLLGGIGGSRQRQRKGSVPPLSKSTRACWLSAGVLKSSEAGEISQGLEDETADSQGSGRGRVGRTLATWSVIGIWRRFVAGGTCRGWSGRLTTRSNLYCCCRLVRIGKASARLQALTPIPGRSRRRRPFRRRFAVRRPESPGPSRRG